MAIRLVTGVPGSGKTLLTIDDVVHHKNWENRPVFYYGIRGLKKDELGWVELTKEELTTVFENKNADELKAYNAFGSEAIVIVDEIQTLYPPEPASRQLRPFIQWCQTHRHHGTDLIFTSQHPSQLHYGLRVLVTDFWYIERQRKVVLRDIKKVPIVKYTWPAFRNDYMSHHAKIAGMLEEIILPSRSYDYYESAEVHTHKQKLNKYQIIIPVLFLLIALFIFWAYSTITGKITRTKNLGQEEIQLEQEQSTSIFDKGFGGMIAPENTPPPEPEVDISYVTIIVDEGADPFFTGSQIPRQPEKFGGCMDTNNICQCFTKNGNIYPISDQQCRETLENPRRFTTYFTYSDNTGGNPDAPPN